MLKNQKTTAQTPLFVMGIALGLISSLTGCGGHGTCGGGFEWPWESDDNENDPPQLVELPATFSQRTDDASVMLDDLELDVIGEDLVVLTYFVTDTDDQDRLVEATFEVTDIYRNF